KGRHRKLPNSTLSWSRIPSQGSGISLLTDTEDGGISARRSEPSHHRSEEDSLFKGKIDPRLIPTDSAPGFEIADVQTLSQLLKSGFQMAVLLSLPFRGIRRWKRQLQNKGEDLKTWELVSHGRNWTST